MRAQRGCPTTRSTSLAPSKSQKRLISFNKNESDGSFEYIPVKLVDNVDKTLHRDSEFNLIDTL